MLRVVIDAADPERFGGFAPGARVAITGADPLTLQSAQVKGRIVSIERTGPEDLAVSTAHRRAFFAAIREADGTERHMAERMVPEALAVCTVTVEECFDQTPGPGAGASVDAT